MCKHKAYKQGLLNYIISNVYIDKENLYLRVEFKEGIEYEYITQALLKSCCLTKYKIVKEMYYKLIKSC